MTLEEAAADYVENRWEPDSPFINSLHDSFKAGATWQQEQYKSERDLLQSELAKLRADNTKMREALEKISAYFDCLDCEMNDTPCLYHLEDRMIIARQAIEETEFDEK